LILVEPQFWVNPFYIALHPSLIARLTNEDSLVQVLTAKMQNANGNKYFLYMLHKIKNSLANFLQGCF
jgi:hypothetical protein